MSAFRSAPTEKSTEDVVVTAATHTSPAKTMTILQIVSEGAKLEGWISLPPRRRVYCQVEVRAEEVR